VAGFCDYNTEIEHDNYALYVGFSMANRFFIKRPACCMRPANTTSRTVKTDVAQHSIDEYFCDGRT